MLTTFAQAPHDDGITLMELIRDVPHDGPAMIVYMLLAAMIAFVWIGSMPSVIERGSKRRDSEGPHGRSGASDS
jgi:hypothetical protein